MNDFKKLRVLIPHWIEHNEEHAREFQVWSHKSGELARDLLAAGDSIMQANAHLAAALAKLGGPLEYQASHEENI